MAPSYGGHLIFMDNGETRGQTGRCGGFSVYEVWRAVKDLLPGGTLISVYRDEVVDRR